MSSKPTLAAAIAAVVFSNIAFSQDNSTPVTREQRKAETRAAEKAGKLTPAGEGRPTTPDSNTKSTKTRAQRKAETRIARKNGELTPAGEAGEMKEEEAERSLHSTKTRAERKAETRLARKNGELLPAGEGPGAPAT
jgi:hypothetical protein